MNALAQIREHWNTQASKGEIAGTQDLILKKLEQIALLQAIGEALPTNVMEVGCGLGETARLVVQTFPRVDLLAVDGAGEMVTQARRTPYPASRLRFKKADVLALPNGRFDVIYTQRMLINLPTWELQREALDAMASRLRPGGRLLLCEHAQSGLDAINDTRRILGLPVIEAPWHNRYLRDDEIKRWTWPVASDGVGVIECRCFSATYYFLSRILNAKLADQQGHAPKYDAPINRLALSLNGGSVAARYAQGRLFVWVKE